MTNYSKQLGLNVVRIRPLPEVGLLGSETGTPTSAKKRKGRKHDRSFAAKNKLSQISGIYESEPANSRLKRSKAFGYPLATKLDDSTFGKYARSHSPGGKGGRGKGSGSGMRKGNRNSDGDGDVNFNGYGYGKNKGKGSGKNNKNSDNNSDILKKKLKNRTKKLEKEALEDRQRKFKALDLNQDKMREKALKAQKKARKRLANRVVDYSFFLDYESPYAEYLPARYREWQPKEPKKHENNFMNHDSSRIGDKLDEVSQIYRHEGPPQSANASVIHSRAGRREKSHNPNSTQLGPDNAFSFAKNLHPKHRKQSSKFETNRKSISNDKRRDQRGRQPIELDQFDDSLDYDSDNEPLKVFKANKKSAKPPKPDKNVNTSMAKSEKGPHLLPNGIDIESNSEGESLRPLFKGRMPHKVYPISDSIDSKEESTGKKYTQNQNTPFSKNFTTGEGIYELQKDSEISSQGVEMIDVNESNVVASEKAPNTKVKINSLF